uniref:MFS transporter n=1 Tax=Bosea sp. NBC_00436 TaxID=2969620 RepID=A0A9E8A9U5_9HYPH
MMNYGDATATTQTGLSKQRTTGVVIGNAFEFYDFGVYAAFAVTIGQVFFPSNNSYLSLLLSVATFGVGFFSRPLGGLLLGAYADRHGRKAAMTLTIALMALSTGAIGLLPSYEKAGIIAPLLLVLARLVQGFSAGGELGASTVYLYEAAPAGRKGFFGSWQLASQGAAGLVVGLVGFLISFYLPKEAVADWGWRIPFLLGLLIIPVGIYIRRNLEETLEAGEAHGSTGAVLSDLLSRYRVELALSVMIFAGVTIAQYFLIYLTSYAINSLKMGGSVAMLASFAVGASTLVFAVLGGWLGDRISLRAICIWPRVLLLLLLYPAMWLVVANPTTATLLTVAAVLTALQAMSAALVILLIARAFPRPIRTTGLSTALGVGAAVFGGTAQVVFTWLISATGNPLSPIWYVLAMNLLSLAGIVLLRRDHDSEGRQG